MALPLQKPKEKSPAQPAGSPPAGAQSMKEPPHPPQVDGFKLKGKQLKGKPKDLANVLRSISFLEIAPEKDLLNVLYIESRDIDKNPYLFSIMKIKEDEIEVIYTIPPEIGPKKRRVDVIRYMLNILSLMESYYQVDNKTVYQLIENAIRELAGSVTMEYTKLYTAYDSMKKEVDDYKKKVERLSEQVQALTSQNYELKGQNDELRLRVNSLEGLSDEALKTKLQEWVAEHSNSINISEFTKIYKVSDARVEEMLNKLVSEGFLEVMQ
ncbi:MAG TPA: hypothetical protein VLD37_05950 [Candidatus Bilamarchaeum sp.]|nr:hypothetical protein [Candidatus Bilamarchaeum sp.]